MSNESEFKFPGLSGVSVELTWLSPTEAKELLELNVKNRRLNEKVVRAYADAMKSGRWDFNGVGNTIVISSSGVLLDGQKRLMAQIKADATLPVIIVRGVNDKAQDTVDIGQPRTVANVLQINGVPNANNVAPVLRSYFYYQNGARGRDVFNHALPDGRRNIQQNVLHDFYNESSDKLQEAVTVGDSVRKRFKPVPQAVIAFTYLLLSEKNKDGADAFFEYLASGVGEEFLSEGSPIAALRQKFHDMDSEAKKNKTRVQPFLMVAYIIKVWNIWSEGGTIKLLKLGSTEHDVEPKDSVKK